MWRALLSGFLIVVGLATAVGTVALWPSGQPVVAESFYQTFPLNKERISAHVIATLDGACTSPESGSVFETSPKDVPGAARDCEWALIGIDSGEHAGKRTLLINSGQPGEPQLHAEEEIVLIYAPDASGQAHYSFADYQRGGALMVWAVVLAVMIIALAMSRGLRALVGLAVTLVIISLFTLPALLLGEDPLLIAVVSGSLILFPVVFLVHGLNWKSASALGGTLIALGIAAGLAWTAIEHTHLRGLGDDGNLTILLYLPEVSVTGLMLCGFIIGALGVLNDVTVAQASTVNELAELDPDASPWRLVVGAMRVGRDHISSMVYTLVLTYTGAALPLLLLLNVADRPLLETLTSDIVATELLRSGVGALALTLAVPITTIVAAWTVARSAGSAPISAAPVNRRRRRHAAPARSRHRR